MIDKARLEQKCSMWNIALTGTQLEIGRASCRERV